MTDTYNDLDNFDLIDEMHQIGEFEGRANALLLDLNDFNHCLLEDAARNFADSIEDAVTTFQGALHTRRIEILKVLRDRGVFEDDDSYTVILEDNERYIYSAKAEYPE